MGGFHEVDQIRDPKVGVLPVPLRVRTVNDVASVIGQIVDRGAVGVVEVITSIPSIP